MRLFNEGKDLTLSEIFFCRTPRRSQPVFACPNPTASPLCLRFCASRAALRSLCPDEQILASLVDWARHEGIFLSPEGLPRLPRTIICSRQDFSHRPIASCSF